MIRPGRTTPTSRSLAGLAAALAALLVALTAGCSVSGKDDELESPRRTVTVAPSPTTAAAPASVPVGKGPVSVGDVVWSQGSRLHVGRRQVDVSPLSIDAFVVVTGGVYLLDRGELWFTDLTRVRGTGLTGLSGLDIASDRSRIRVTGSTGAGSTYAYETAGGRRVAVDGFVPLSESDRLGTPVTLRVRATGTLAGRQGPDRFAMATDGRGTPVAVDTLTRERLPLRGEVPRRFTLGGWTRDGAFYGTGVSAGRDSVVTCDVARGVCTGLGRTSGTDPVLFGAGV